MYPEFYVSYISIKQGKTVKYSLITFYIDYMPKYVNIFG